MNWSDIAGDDEESEDDDDDDDSDDELEEEDDDEEEEDLGNSSSESFSESFASSLSMSVESHSLQSPPQVMKAESNEPASQQRKLSLSLVYEEGMDIVETYHHDSNPLSYNDKESDEDTDFQKLSFTRTRKMSDAGGW